MGEGGKAPKHFNACLTCPLVVFVVLNVERVVIAYSARLAAHGDEMVLGIFIGIEAP